MQQFLKELGKTALSSLKINIGKLILEKPYEAYIDKDPKKNSLSMFALKPLPNGLYYRKVALIIDKNVLIEASEKTGYIYQKYNLEELLEIVRSDQYSDNRYILVFRDLQKTQYVFQPYSGDFFCAELIHEMENIKTIRAAQQLPIDECFGGMIR